MYSVGQTGSENGISYIYWKTTEEPEYVPDFAEAREQVEQAWRMAKALDVAKDDAAKLIARIEASGETLAEFFANNEDITKNEIIETNEFSWMSTGFTAASFGVPALSHVDGVESTGTEFMEAVFAMQPGEVGVAINQPQTIVYLVRIISETPSEDLLRQRFLQSGITSEIAYLSDVENFELRRKWYADLETEMGVVWLR